MERKNNKRKILEDKKAEGVVGKFREILGGIDYTKNLKELLIKTHKASEMIQAGGRHDWKIEGED